MRENVLLFDIFNNEGAMVNYLKNRSLLLFAKLKIVFIYLYASVYLVIYMYINIFVWLKLRKY